MIKTNIKDVGRWGDGGVFRFELDAKTHWDFGCSNCKDFVDVQSKTNEMRREVHCMIDHYIDSTVSDFLKNEFKKID